MKERTKNEIEIKRTVNGTTTTVATVPITEDSTRTFSLMSEDNITLVFETVKPIFFRLGDFIDDELFGEFVITDLANMPSYDTETGAYRYNLQFDADYFLWKNKICKYIPDAEAKETSFTLTANIETHCDVIVRNLFALGFKHGGKYYTVNYTTYNINDVIDTEKAELVSYDSVSIYDAISAIAEAFDCEWWVDGSVIFFGTCQNAGQTVFQLGDNVSDMSRSGTTEKAASRVYFFGSDKNLPKTYRQSGTTPDVTHDGVVQKRLMLPAATYPYGYMQDAEVETENQAVEKVVVFDDIYPVTRLKVSGISTYTSTKTDDTTGEIYSQTFWRVKEDSDFLNNFTKDMIIDGLTLHIVFTSGVLNGMDFECALVTDDSTLGKCFEIVANDTYGRDLPDSVLCPSAGDEFCLYNWDATKMSSLGLVEKAETTLAERAVEYFKQSKIDASTYTATLFSEYAYNSGTFKYFLAGDQIKLINGAYFTQVDSDGNHYRLSRIIGFEFKLDKPYDSPQYTLGEKPEKSNTMQSMQETIDSIKVNGATYINQTGSGSGGTSVYVIGMSDNTLATDANVYSARRSDQQYLRKDIDDTTDHTLTVGVLKTKTFDGDGFVGHGARIDKDGNLVAKSIYAREFMSAPKFVFNEISVTNAEQWSTNAYGTILSVDKDKRLITLKLEENEYGSVSVGDICRGMYADIGNEYNSDSNSEGSVDECGFTVHKGFFTTYFCVTEIVTNEKGSCVFRYKKRVPSGPDPCKFMDFAQYGSFTDTSRQSSMFMSSRGQSYHMILAGVNDWMIRPQMRVACYGCLDGITVLMKDGSEQELKGYGIYVQKNVYFGGAVVQLKDISDLEDLQKMAGSYDVQLSNYAGVITVDDLGNVIGGLYTTNSNGDKQYRLATTTYVRKGDEILTYEPDDTLDEPTEGHYRLQVISEDCTVEVHNSTAYITAIRNLRDGVSGTDETIDYDRMRKMNACRVTLIVELEGKTVKSIEYPIRIAHDSLPFMLCDLTNEHDSVSWNTKERKYIGFPVETGISMLYHNDPYDIATVEVTNLPSGLKATITDNGKRKNITFALDGTKDGDFLLQTQDINIHVTSTYAGAVYEYDKVFTLDKKSDAVIWDIIPTSDCVVANKLGVLSATSLGVDVYGTSTDDKRFKVEFADLSKYNLTLWYKKASDASEQQITSDTTIPVAKGDMSVTFILKNSNGGIEDKEEVPVVAWGEDGKGVEFIYKRTENGATLSPSDNPTPSDWESPASAYQTNTEYVSNIGNGWTDNPQGADSTHNIEYVCVRKSVNGVWGRFSDPAPFATFTTGVKSINTFYGVFDNGVSPSSGDGFTYDTIDAAVISANAGKYVWSADFVTYSDGKTEWKDFVLVGKCDDIATVEEMYAVTDSPTDIPTENSNWSSSLSGIMSQITNGKALWSCDYITYRNNSGTKHINIQFVGSAGKNGNSITVKDTLSGVDKLPTSGVVTGDSYVINGLLYVYTGAPDSTGSDSDYDDVGDTYRGFTNVGKLQGDAGKSNYIHTAWCNTSDNSDNSFIKSNPSGKGYAYFGTKIDENASDDSLGFSDYNWQCVKGESVTITGTEINYQISNNGTNPPTTWSETIVSATDEKPFLWTKMIVNFSGKVDPLVSYSVSYKGKDGKGVNIKSKVVKYAVTTDSTQPSDDAFIYDSIDAAGVTIGRYVWCMTVITYDDASNTTVKSYSVTRIGADGKGISHIESAYTVVAKGTTPTGSENYGDDISSLLIPGNKDKAVWSADRIHYVDGTIVLGNFAFVGNVSDIATVQPTYDWSVDVNSSPSGVWYTSGELAAQHATGSGYALWSSDYVKWNDGTSDHINIQCIGVVGKQGEQGQEGPEGPQGEQGDPGKDGAPTGRNLLRGAALESFNEIYDDGVLLYRTNVYDSSRFSIVDGVDGSKAASVNSDSGASLSRGILFKAKVEPGIKYTASIYAKGSGLSFCTELIESSGSSRGSWYSETVYKTATSSWQRYSVTFTAHSGYSYVEVNFWSNDGGTMYYSQPKLERGDTATAFCLNEKDLVGKQGDNGSRGPMPRTYSSVKSNTTYYSGADGETEQSFVYSQKNSAWYVCVSTFTAGSDGDPSDSNNYSGHFSLANNFENVATEVLLAQRAKIYNLYVDDIDIVDSHKNTLATMNKDGITCNTGTFNNVTVNGTINSTSGSIGGMQLAKYTMQSSRIDEGDWNADYSQCTFDNGMAIGTKGFVIGDIWSAVAMGKLACSFGIKYVDGESTLPNYRYIHGVIPSNTHQIHDIALLVQYRQQTSPAVVYSNGYGALTVDSNGVGIESLSQNAFGGMALGTIVSSSLTSSETDAINKNRVSYLVMTNGAETTISLPSQPMTGQRFTVIQGNSGSINFNSNKNIQTGSKIYYSSSSTRPHSGTTGQWNKFLFDGTVWRASYEQGTL